MHRRRTALALSVVAAAAASLTIAAPAAASDRDERIVPWALVCTLDGVCLAYTAALADSDGDGIADVDEVQLGTKVKDAASAPSVDELTGVIGKGALPSFEMGFSEIIVIPKTLPDGTRLIPDELTAGRDSALSRLGIDEGLLKDFGLSVSGGLAIDQVLGTVGMKLGKDGRPVKQDGAPPVTKRVGGIGIGEISQEAGDGPVLGDQPAMGTDRNGGKDTAKTLGERAWELLFGKDKDGGTPPTGGADGGTPAPKALTTGDEGNVVLPLSPKDMEQALIKLGFNRTPVRDDPKGTPDPDDIDFNPNRTIILTVDPEPTKRFESLLKIVLVEPDPENPANRNTNFGPNGGIVPDVVGGSGWPKL